MKMTIADYATALKLPRIKNNYKDLIHEANENNFSYEQLISKLLEEEYQERQNNGYKNRVRRAKFDTIHYLCDYDKTQYKKSIQESMCNLTDLSFIKRNENIILIGNPGVGKTHFAIALGFEACKNNYNVLFSNIPNLVIEMKEALSNSQLTSFKRKFMKYDLIILDELGYVSFDQEGSEILFNLISNKNNNGSIIITSNLLFDKWKDVFGDPILTGALIDRLIQKSHVLDMSGESQRVKEAKKRSRMMDQN